MVEEFYPVEGDAQDSASNGYDSAVNPELVSKLRQRAGRIQLPAAVNAN
jgi:hypothetical protein